MRHTDHSTWLYAPSGTPDPLDEPLAAHLILEILPTNGRDRAITFEWHPESDLFGVELESFTIRPHPVREVWTPRIIPEPETGLFPGARDGVRTRDPQLGKAKADQEGV